jgi:transcriptional regulator with XRE-family HTH domain
MRLKRTIEVPKLALKIKVALVEANKTVKAVSQEMGISVSQWHSLLKSESVLSYELLLKMEAALGVKFPPDVVGGVGFESVSIYKEGLAATSSIGQALTFEQALPAVKLAIDAEQEDPAGEDIEIPSHFPQKLDGERVNPVQQAIMRSMMVKPTTFWATHHKSPAHEYEFIDALLLSCVENNRCPNYLDYTLRVECTNPWTGIRHTVELDGTGIRPNLSDKDRQNIREKLKASEDPWANEEQLPAFGEEPDDYVNTSQDEDEGDSPEILRSPGLNEYTRNVIKALLAGEAVTFCAMHDKFPSRVYPFIDAVYKSDRYSETACTYMLEVECTNLWDGTRHSIEIDSEMIRPETTEAQRAEYAKQLKLNPNPWGGTSAKAASRANLKLA